jgi:hypothetical protein
LERGPRMRPFGPETFEGLRDANAHGYAKEPTERLLVRQRARSSGPLFCWP